MGPLAGPTHLSTHVWVWPQGRPPPCDTCRTSSRRYCDGNPSRARRLGLSPPWCPVPLCAHPYLLLYFPRVRRSWSQRLRGPFVFSPKAVTEVGSSLVLGQGCCSGVGPCGLPPQLLLNSVHAAGRAASPPWAEPTGCSAQSLVHSRGLTRASLLPGCGSGIVWCLVSDPALPLAHWMSLGLSCTSLSLSFLVWKMRMTLGPPWCTVMFVESIGFLTFLSDFRRAATLMEIPSPLTRRGWAPCGIITILLAATYYLLSTYCVPDSTKCSLHRISYRSHHIRDRE